MLRASRLNLAAEIGDIDSDDPKAVIQNWMRNRDVIEFLGLWERLHNLEFKPIEFEEFRKQARAKMLLQCHLRNR